MDDLQELALPSTIVKARIESPDRTYTIHIPRNEAYLIKEIIYDNEYAIMNARRRKGPLRVVDIGANVGLFSIYMKFRDPEAVIHCFEPSSDTFSLLEANVGNLPGVSLHPYGLSDRRKASELHIHRFQTGQNSTKPNNGQYSGSIPILLESAAFEFDRLGLDAIDVLKVDTEGCEVEILQSLKNRLPDIDYVLVEYHFEEDRRLIDQILGEFHLFASKSRFLHLGTVKYVNSRLIER
ncbi:MAG: FkbM family methyltransferase [Desulfobacteraceae bacterium]|nr:MAG: FkbM family methyltransferase [Desulfobacteraceae bacterium]